MKKLVIVGGGFGGLNAAKRLSGFKDIDITLVDQRNHHLFQPLLYQVAMAGLSPADIAVPIRNLLSKKRNVRVIMSQVLSVSLANKELLTSDGPLPYDSLILACGATHSYFGHNEWEPFAPGLKTLEQATEIRRRVLLAFEDSEKERNPERQKALETFIVIGAGPTGVELAGSLGEMSHQTLAQDFKHLDPKKSRILLIEAGPRVLPSFSEELSARAVKDLEGLGVSVLTNCRVTNVRAEGVETSTGFFPSACVLWAAGVKPSPINASLGTPLDPQGRVIVNADLSLPGHAEVFVIGDQAVGSSRVDLQACKLEYSIVSPK